MTKKSGTLAKGKEILGHQNTILLSAYEENTRRPTSLDYSSLQKISTDNKIYYFLIFYSQVRF